MYRWIRQTEETQCIAFWPQAGTGPPSDHGTLSKCCGIAGKCVTQQLNAAFVGKSRSGTGLCCGGGGRYHSKSSRSDGSSDNVKKSSAFSSSGAKTNQWTGGIHWKGNCTTDQEHTVARHAPRTHHQFTVWQCLPCCQLPESCQQNTRQQVSLHNLHFCLNWNGYIIMLKSTLQTVSVDTHCGPQTTTKQQ